MTVYLKRELVRLSIIQQHPPILSDPDEVNCIHAANLLIRWVVARRQPCCSYHSFLSGSRPHLSHNSNDGQTTIKKGKGMFLCSAVSSRPLDRSKRFPFHPPGRPVQSDTNSTSLGRVQPCGNYCVKASDSHISNTVHNHVLVYTAELTGVQWRERKCPSFKMPANGIRTWAL